MQSPIETCAKHNLEDCVKLALKLYEDAEYDELFSEFKQLMTDPNWRLAVFKRDNQAIAFIQLSLRNDYVEGCLHKPVLYLEGIYVEADYRKSGIAKELIDYAQKWGLENNCKEMASDATLANNLSHRFHKAIGFREVNRLVAYKKDL